MRHKRYLLTLLMIFGMTIIESCITTGGAKCGNIAFDYNNLMITSATEGTYSGESQPTLIVEPVIDSTEYVTMQSIFGSSLFAYSCAELYYPMYEIQDFDVYLASEGHADSLINHAAMIDYIDVNGHGGSNKILSTDVPKFGYNYVPAIELTIIEPPHDISRIYSVRVSLTKENNETAEGISQFELRWDD